MPRLPEAPPGAVRPTTRLWFWFQRCLFGRVLAPYRVAAHAPRVASGYMLANVMFGTGDWELEPALRTFVQLRVAQLLGCPF